MGRTAQDVYRELVDLDEIIRGRLSWLSAHPEGDDAEFRRDLAKLRVRRHALENELPYLPYRQPASPVGDLVAL